MTDKPKVFAIVDKHRAAGVMLITHGHDSLKDGDKLIRLTDHEASRAADKARIAELMGLLREAKPSLYCHSSGPAGLRLASRIDEALAQQGKEGGV